jgi:[acyl-carrier-protein] S-malonyltransferase
MKTLESAPMNPQRLIICPGQGAQAVGMGKAWFERSPEARATFAEADRILGSRLGSPLSTLCFEGPAERLNQTDVSQPAIFVTSVASWRGVLAASGATIADMNVGATLGLSLGEYTALHVAGAIDFASALELVTLRGRAMQDAAEASPGGMVALIGADESQALAVCDKARGSDVLVCANFNAPGQIVLSGSKPACERAAAAASELGLRATVLVVAGAFHSPLMAPAADRLREALRNTAVSVPSVPVISNVTAQAHAATASASIADSIRARLVEQLTSPVRWSQSCQHAIAQFPGASIHELSPGKTLAGLMRRIEKSAKVTSHDEPEPIA